MPTLADSSETLVVEVAFSEDALTVVLDDGRAVSVPLAWFPRLLNATPKQRKQWELIGGGMGIHWEAIDEDISVASLLRPEKFMRLADFSPQARALRTTRSRPSRPLSSRPSASPRPRKSRAARNLLFGMGPNC